MMKHLQYITNILLTYWTSPSQNVIIFPPKTSTVDSSRAPQRERFLPRRRDLERFLLFRLEIEKNWIRRKSHVKSAAENQQERVNWKFSLESPDMNVLKQGKLWLA